MERKYTGIILKKQNAREADRIYTIYTLEAGKIRAIAQGARKPLAKLAGHLEDFNLADIMVIKKNGLGRITGSVVENNFADLRNNLEALRCAFRGARQIDRLTEIEDKDGSLFDLLLQFLTALNKSAEENKNVFDLLYYGFAFKLLGLLGYAVEVRKCVKCSGALAENGSYFSPERGGAICEKCSGKIGEKIRISGNVVKIIRIFPQNKIGALVKLKVDKKDLDNLSLVSSRFLDWVGK